VRAHDGSPLHEGKVVVHREDFVEPTLTLQLDAEGQFRGEVTPGMYVIAASGADHAREVLRLPVMGPVEIHGTLSTESSDAPGESHVDIQLSDPDLQAAFDLFNRWQRATHHAYVSAANPASATPQLEAIATQAQAEEQALPTPRAKTIARALRLLAFEMFLPLEGEALLREVEWLLEHVPPETPWLGAGPFIHVLDRAELEAEPPLKQRITAWQEACAHENTEPVMALSALAPLIHRAHEQGNAARVARLYALVDRPGMAGTHTATYLTNHYDPERLLRPGASLPALDFPALDPHAPRITSAGVLEPGRLYLVEFWASWCAPCVKDMPYLHHAYATINGTTKDAPVEPNSSALPHLAAVDDPAVEFVFVSLDDTPETVQSFRDQQWSMPWIHAFAGRANQDEVYDRFGFSSVPTPVLVDATGTILATGTDLRHEELLPTLQRFLASATPPTDDAPPPRAP